ncbi:urokinase plasminogen activator surface receptor-like [Danio rerio]|uniref:Urokinase plasminogen activator surface receptor-like n=1 Tax=Danio rerio TaxID=7955 RepID=A0A8M9PCV3_DANRE|nr:prostate stem cell antigen-like [Danio rerio]|eukprot:XP_021324603.1 prostate stem cell antigen-like [Danio rerio]
MDLQVSVLLLFVTFTSGHSLSCYQCDDLMGLCRFQTERTCPSGLSKCESVTVVRQLGTTSFTVKAKACSADCASGTMNFGISQMSSTCCNSDQCNKKDAPVPSTGTPNGKMCYYCDENNCFNALSYSGREDHCITATGTFAGESVIVKGCASKSICDGKKMGAFKNFSCCSGNLCNGAKSVTQSFLFLCFPLIAFILML